MTGYRFYHIDPLGVEYPLTDDVNTFLALGGMFGFGLMRLDIASQRLPYQHGATVIGDPYMPAREMGITINIKDTTHADWAARDRALRDNCSPFKSPSDLCILKILRPDDAERRIAAYLVDYPNNLSDMDGPFFGLRTLMYWAPDPAFYDPTAVTVAWGVTPGGGFTFPFTMPFTFVAVPDSGGFTFPFTFSLTFEAANVTARQVINYEGTLPTWPVLRCYGPGDYPRLTHETLDQAVQVVQAMDSGDYIDLDMAAPDGVVATFHDATDNSDTDVTNLLTNDTELWHLQPGENPIKVTMAGTTSNGVLMTYRKRYLAV